MDGVLTYMKEQDAVVDNHETRIAHLEDCESRQGRYIQLILGAGITIVVGIILAVIKAQMGI